MTPTKEERLKRRRLQRLERCIYSMLDESKLQYERWLTTKIDQMRWQPAKGEKP